MVGTTCPSRYRLEHTYRAAMVVRVRVSVRVRVRVRVRALTEGPRNLGSWDIGPKLRKSTIAV